MNDKTLRLFFPQWQGGNNAPYYFGAQLLEWLAPQHTGPYEQVLVDLPSDDILPTENGIVARHILLQQAERAKHLITQHNPDKITIIGGDCLVDLVPFAYLIEKYKNDLAILWVDAHPDVMTPKEFSHAHAMVLGNLLGQGDQDFLNFVKHPVQASHVMFAGLEEVTEIEDSFISKFNLKHASAEDLRSSSQPIIDWFKSTGAKYLAIHLDLDVLHVTQFRSILFAEPNVSENKYEGIAQGKMSTKQVVHILNDVSQIAEIVGLGITEHLPWDALALKEMLSKLPLIGYNK